MNRFDSAMKQLRERLTASVGDSIIYRRGGQSATLSTYSGKTAFRFSDQQGNSIVEWSDRDFFIAADQLILNGVVVTPLRGDVIEIAFTSGTLAFEVVSPNDEQCWRYSDTSRTIIRIHTKQING